MNEPMMVLLGAVLAGVLVGAIHRTRPGRRHGLYGLALIAAVLVYVGFALVAGASVVEEVGGGLIFVAMAVAGMRGYPSALIVGWAGHAWWDVAVHGSFSAIAPAWYPPLCLGFDLVVAGAILQDLLAQPARGDGSA